MAANLRACTIFQFAITRTQLQGYTGFAAYQRKVNHDVSTTTRGIQARLKIAR